MNPHVNEPTHQHPCSLSLSWFSEEPLTLIFFSLTYLCPQKENSEAGCHCYKSHSFTSAWCYKDISRSHMCTLATTVYCDAVIK